MRPLTVLIALVALAAYATVMLRGPQGLAALTQKRTVVRSLEEENANLQREIDEKKRRIERLRSDRGAQELEVRKRLKLQRPGDTSFVLPDQSPALDGGSKAPQPAPQR